VSSASRDSDAAVKPTRSAKSTETMRRSVTRGTYHAAGAGAPGRSAAPHSPQNFCPGELAAPHEPQIDASAAPHSPQNLWVAACAAPQLGSSVAK
jgi:hypothetical protein